MDITHVSTPSHQSTNDSIMMLKYTHVQKAAGLVGISSSILMLSSGRWNNLKSREPDTKIKLCSHHCTCGRSSHQTTLGHQQKIWWRHQMEIFSALLTLCVGNSPFTVNSPHKGQWRGALMSSLIYAWTDSWANNGDAGDLRCHL